MLAEPLGYTSTYLTPMLLQTAIFLTISLALHTYVSHAGPIPLSRTITAINSRLYSAASFLLLLFTLVTTPDTTADLTARKLYHISKLYEYVDILNVVASGGSVGLHFALHHLTTPYFTFFRVLQHPNRWRWFAAMNAGHHVLMYAYFGGVQSVRPVLDWTGHGQLVGGLLVETWCVWEEVWEGEGREEELLAHVFAGMLLGCYLGLSVRDLAMREVREEEGKKGAQGKDQGKGA